MRENRASIQDVLDREWVPPATSPSKADLEIWSAMLLLHLTDPGATPKDVSDYLLDLAISELGMVASIKLRERCSDVARSLFEMRSQFYEH